MPEPALSVVIPTRDRFDALSQTLDALEAEERPAPFEVIVVDDGSVPGSLDPLRSRSRSFVCHWLRQDGQGPAVARNLGWRKARSERLLFLGDDTRPAPGGLRHHFEPEAIGIQGPIDWDPEQEITDVMRFLAPAGPQFYFKGLRPEAPVPFTAVLGSNFSAPRRWLETEPFDEGFPYAALEDTELALRFEHRGWQTVYRPAALCWHNHRYASLEPFLARQRRAGAAGRYALARQPRLLRSLILEPLLFFPLVLVRAVGPGSLRRRHARWDLRCRLAFLRGLLSRHPGDARRSHR